MYIPARAIRCTKLQEVEKEEEEEVQEANDEEQKKAMIHVDEK